jgi:hypothetical protein
VLNQKEFDTNETWAARVKPMGFKGINMGLSPPN